MRPGGLAALLPMAVITGSTQECSSLRGGPQYCTGGPSTLHQVIALILVAVCVLDPIFTSVYLPRRAR